MNRQTLEYLARKYGLAAVLVLAILIFLLPLFVRLVHDAPITPGAQSYNELRAADLMSSGQVGYDPLYGVRVAPNPYTAVLAVMQLFGAPWLLPVLLALFFLVLLYHYLMGFISARPVIVLALIAMILAPSTSVLATHHGTALLCLIFLVLSLMMIDKNTIVGSLFAWLATLTNPTIGLLGILFLIIVRRKQYRIVIGLAAAFLAGLIWHFAWTGNLAIVTPSFNTDIFFEFGNAAGLSVFLLILAVRGVIIKPKSPLVLPLAAVVLATLIVPLLIPVAVILLSVVAAQAIFELMTAVWDLDLLRSSLLVLILCIGLFLFITVVRERADEVPNADLAHTMVTLRNQYREGAVLTDPSYAPLIEYYTGRRATLDESTPKETVQAALFSRSPEVVYSLLERSRTSYVLVTSDMMSSRFSRSDQGILFLLKNTERFIKVQQSQESTLWYFITTN